MAVEAVICNSRVRDICSRADCTASTILGVMYVRLAFITSGAILERLSISSAHFGREKTRQLHRLGHSSATARQW